MGLQGVGTAERAYQQAREYARERCRAGCPGARAASSGSPSSPPGRAPHADDDEGPGRGDARVRLRRRCDIDLAHRHPDAAERRRRQDRTELLMLGAVGAADPARRRDRLAVASRSTAGWATSRRPARASTCATPHRPDLRGHHGIEAADLVGRKPASDNGAATRALVAEMRRPRPTCWRADDQSLAVVAAALDAVESLEGATAQRGPGILAADPDAALAAWVSSIRTPSATSAAVADGTRALVARAKLVPR